MTRPLASSKVPWGGSRVTCLLASANMSCRRFSCGTPARLSQGAVDEVLVWHARSPQPMCRGGGSRVTRPLASTKVPWGRFSWGMSARLSQGAVEEVLV